MTHPAQYALRRLALTTCTGQCAGISFTSPAWDNCELGATSDTAGHSAQYVAKSGQVQTPTKNCYDFSELQVWTFQH